MSPSRNQRSQRLSRLNGSSDCVCLTVPGCIILKTTHITKYFHQNICRSLRGHKTTKLTLPTDKKAAFSFFISTTCQGHFGSKPMNLPKIDRVIFRHVRHVLLKEQTAICRRIKYPGQNYTRLFLKGRPGKKSKSIRVALLSFLNGKYV